MAIDAVIERIRPHGSSLWLHLAPRVDSEGKDTCPGRERLVILGKRTFEPAVGMEIWGGADSCEIVKGAEYDRKGVHLREARNCPKCFRRMRWASLTDTTTGEQSEEWLCWGCTHREPLDGTEGGEE